MCSLKVKVDVRIPPFEVMSDDILWYQLTSKFSRIVITLPKNSDPSYKAVYTGPHNSILLWSQEKRLTPKWKFAAGRGRRARGQAHLGGEAWG